MICYSRGQGSTVKVACSRSSDDATLKSTDASSASESFEMPLPDESITLTRISEPSSV